MPGNETTAEDRCWPCTVANSVVGLVVGWIPFAAAVARGRTSFIIVSAVWAVAVTAYTSYRLLALGYLPYAEPVAKWTGLHDRIGPGSKSRSSTDGPDDE